ncbi:hypothetical protein BC628DRAFT_1194169 [Trametes gibbosa]|nr:hypothetical protein BC628DRAFT_1194169 [Trametes gibbosa]
MFVKSFATLLVLALGARAAPAKRDDSSSSSATPASTFTLLGDPLTMISGLPAGATNTPEAIISFIQVNSEAVASAVGTATMLDLEASFVMAEAMTVVQPTETQLSVFMADVAGTPIVEVSSIGGPGITLATGTASGIPTTFAGHLFTAAPKANHAVAGFQLPGGLAAGGLTMIGSVALGVIAVL